MQATDPLRVNREVSWREHCTPDESQQIAINLRPVRFHEVVDQRLPSRLTDVEVADGRIEPDLRDGDACMALVDEVAFLARLSWTSRGPRACAHAYPSVLDTGSQRSLRNPSSLEGSRSKGPRSGCRLRAQASSSGGDQRDAAAQPERCTRLGPCKLSEKATHWRLCQRIVHYVTSVLTRRMQRLQSAANHPPTPVLSILQWW
jgi:hypothetical protein